MIDRPNRPREPLPTSVHGLSELPAEYRRALEAGLASLAARLTPEAQAAIDGHVRLLLAWAPAINLTAIRYPACVALRHVVDSLTGLPFILGANSFLDLGSGGGFPGLPLAAAAPTVEALLVESIAKKARFLSTVVEATGLGPRVRVAADRAEALAALPANRGRWPVVTARAVGSLPTLVELALPLLRPGGRLVAWKRGDTAAEVAEARRALPRFGGASVELVPSQIDGLPGHILVVVTKRGHARRVPARDRGMRARRGR